MGSSAELVKSDALSARCFGNSLDHGELPENFACTGKAGVFGENLLLSAEFYQGRRQLIALVTADSGGKRPRKVWLSRKRSRGSHDADVALLAASHGKQVTDYLQARRRWTSLSVGGHVEIQSAKA